MRKEDLFEIIGELDDNFVKAAKTPVKKRINWKAVGTMAACFTVMCIAVRGLSLTGFHSSKAPAETATPSETWDAAPMEEAPAEEAPTASMEEEYEEAVQAEETDAPVEESEAPAGDLEPMVYVNDILYRLSPDQESHQERTEEFIYLGEIESAVSSDSIPKQNMQANDPLIGCEVYQYGENIVVKMDDSYLLYEIYGAQ